MNQQETIIAIWRAMHQQMSDNFAAASVETQLLRGQVAALQADLAELMKPKDAPKLEAVPKESA